MVRTHASGLLVTKSHYENSPEYLSKLIRAILYGYRITNRQFHDRYHVAHPPEPGLPARNQASRISALCGDIYNNEKFMSYYIFSTIITVLGMDIKDFSIVIQSDETKELYQFSTTMSVKTIDDMFPDRVDSWITPQAYDNAPGDLSKLLRGVFRAFGITRKGFQECYRNKYAELDKTEKRSSSSRISAFFLSIRNDNKSVSFYLLESILRVIGYRIVEMMVTLEDRITKEVRQFSTKMSADEIDADTERHDVVGIDSL